MALLMRDPAELLMALEPSRERLHALPGVIGTGVGLRDAEPVVEIFVTGSGDAELERAIREIVDVDFVLVPESHPAEAQAPDREAKE